MDPDCDALSLLFLSSSSGDWNTIGRNALVSASAVNPIRVIRIRL